MTLTEYDFRQLNKENVHHLAPLMKNAFGREVPDDYFQWKFFDNPNGNVVGMIAVERTTGTVAGYYGLIPELYRFGDRLSRVYQATDAMTHSGHQRKGLFRRLCLATYECAELKDQGFVGVGFSGANLVKPYVEMGWQVPFHIPFYFKPRILSRLASFMRRSAAQPFLASPTSASNVSDDLVELILSGRLGWKNSIVFSPEVVRWRLSNPRIGYEQLVDPGVAYAIAYESNGFIFLLDFHEVEPRAGSAIMHALEARVVERRLKGILTFSQRGAPYEKTLRRHGFLRNDLGRGPASYRIPFITWGSAANSDFVHRPEAWAITPLDHDSY